MPPPPITTFLLVGQSLMSSSCHHAVVQTKILRFTKFETQFIFLKHVDRSSSYPNLIGKRVNGI